MTEFHSNIEEVITKFQALSASQQGVDYGEALLFGVNAAKGDMQQRIFNKGMDASGQPIGQYKGKKKKNSILKGNQKADFLGGTRGEFTYYELKRLKAGRQVRYKDLEFTGDLRRGIIVNRQTDTLVVCSIVNDKLILISEGQEEQTKKEIFKLSEEERQTLIDNTSEALKQLYVRIFNIT